MRRLPFTKRAFTLIELLIVIAIISILAGMIFPVFAATREKARQTTCASNMRQIGLAFTQYAQDNDGVFPSGAAPDGQGWASQVYPYVRSPRVYVCPDDTTRGANYTISYAMNRNLAALGDAAMNAPSETVLAFEVNDSITDMTKLEGASPVGRGLSNENNGKPFGADYYATGNFSANAVSTTAFPYHVGASNYLAADGHVKRLAGSVVSSGLDAVFSTDPEQRATGAAAGSESMVLVDGRTAELTFSAR